MAYSGVAIALLVLLSNHAVAAVEILEVQGNLEHWVVYDSRHSPCAGAGWSHAVNEGATFDLQATSYDESCVVSNWTGRCGPTGFLYAGEILPVTDGSLGWWVFLQSRITVLLSLTEPTQITATRTVNGMLLSPLHTVSLTLPDGSTDDMLAVDSEMDSATRLLDPGVHRVTFSIDANAVWDIPFSYSGLVEVNWEAPVGQDTQTWGRLKSLYR
jgi:hypothetical protein